MKESFGKFDLSQGIIEYIIIVGNRDGVNFRAVASVPQQLIYFAFGVACVSAVVVQIRPEQFKGLFADADFVP
jgi:hypothetical protein